MYEIFAPELEAIPEGIEELYEDPRLLLHDLDRLKKLFPGMKFVITKDGSALPETKINDELERFLIGSEFRREDKVRSGYRPAWGGDGDIANGDTGRVGVWKPPNPED